VKLLFDENLSPKLSDLVAAEYPASIHVRTVGLQGADDQHVWDYARTEGFAIASKDNDFRQRSFVFGSPPKVVWLDVGNAGTATITDLLRRAQSRVEVFASDPETSLLVLSLSSPRP
jgi:predicted nuclease of predicted toxin-antitoxin system